MIVCWGGFMATLAAIFRSLRLLTNPMYELCMLSYLPQYPIPETLSSSRIVPVVTLFKPNAHQLSTATARLLLDFMDASSGVEVQVDKRSHREGNGF